jgi:hypothetical protein
MAGIFLFKMVAHTAFHPYPFAFPLQFLSLNSNNLNLL